MSTTLCPPHYHLFHHHLHTFGEFHNSYFFVIIVNQNFFLFYFNGFEPATGIIVVPWTSYRHYCSAIKTSLQILDSEVSQVWLYSVWIFFVFRQKCLCPLQLSLESRSTRLANGAIAGLQVWKQLHIVIPNIFVLIYNNIIFWCLVNVVVLFLLLH